MGLLSAVSVSRILLSVQRQSFLVKPILAYPFVQKCLKSDDLLVNSQKVINEYIQRGKLAAEHPSKSLLLLEDLIKDYARSKTYRKLLSTKEYKDFGLEDQFFIALALPSMTGKTQMAFNIRCKRPFYFALRYSQIINNCFGLISSKFKSLLESDYDRMRSVVKSKIVVGDNSLSDETINILKNEATEIITLDMLNNFLIHNKFESLGFIFSLIKECEKSYTEKSNDDWMRFYAENQASLQFLEYEPISLAEFKFRKDSVYNALLEKYFFFVDEFSADPGVVMFRNMCRYLSTPCVVASTNSKVVNLIGASDISGSGSSYPSVFCAVFPKLSTLSQFEIEKFFNDDLNCRFLELARNVSESEKSRMSLLLQFFKGQAKVSRPGVSIYLFQALEKLFNSFPQLESLKVDEVFQHVVEQMVDSIYYRKKITFSKLEGMRSNVRLLCGNEYDSDFISLINSKSDKTSMIDNHFFYLKNPISDPEKPFLLFHTELTSGPAIVEYPKSQEPFSTQAYFDENEELLKLVCLLCPMAYTSYRIAYPINEPKYYAPDAGAKLESITNVAFLESSHFNEKKKFSLEGVGIKEFLKNLFVSFNRTSNNIRAHKSNLKVNYESVKDDQIMAKTVVPSLYITNHDWPAEIKAIFDPKESSFKLGKYTRTPNISEIDATIDLIDKYGRNCLGVIECKNRGSPIIKTEYKLIIEKAIKYAKIKKIENFLDSLRPIVKSNMIKSFTKYIKGDLKKNILAPKDVKNNEISFKNLIDNFEDSSKFQVAKNQMKNFIKEEHLNEFENLLLDLEKLKTTTPLFHFLICKSCSDLKSLAEDFPGPKINFFRFIKCENREYKIVNLNTETELHNEPDMVAFIIETYVVNNIQK